MQLRDFKVFYIQLYCRILNKDTSLLLPLPDTIKIKRVERWLGRAGTSFICTSNTVRQTNMGIESSTGRFHFGKVEEEIYCHTVHCLVKCPSGNTGRRIGALVNCPSSAWWPHPNCIDQEGEWLKHALDEIRSGFDIDLNLKPRADFMATIHSPVL